MLALPWKSQRAPAATPRLTAPCCGSRGSRPRCRCAVSRGTASGHLMSCGITMLSAAATSYKAETTQQARYGCWSRRRTGQADKQNRSTARRPLRGGAARHAPRDVRGMARVVLPWQNTVKQMAQLDIETPRAPRRTAPRSPAASFQDSQAPPGSSGRRSPRWEKLRFVDF